MVQLLDFLSQTYSVTIDADDIQPENFSTLSGIANLITARVNYA